MVSDRVRTAHCGMTLRPETWDVTHDMESWTDPRRGHVTYEHSVRVFCVGLVLLAQRVRMFAE